MYKILKYIKKLFSRTSDKSATLGAAYAVTTGTYVGEIFVYIDKDDDNMFFLSIPKMLNREVPIEKFKYAIKENVVEYLQIIPKNERVVCKAQYEANEQS